MGVRKLHSTQVGLVLIFLTDSILPQYYVVFDYILSTVASIASTELEFCMRLDT